MKKLIRRALRPPETRQETELSGGWKKYSSTLEFVEQQ